MSGLRKQRCKQAVRRGADAARRLLCRLGALVSVSQRARRGTIFSVVLPCAFFALYYLYVREYLDPQLLYHANGVVLPSGELVYFPICQQGAAFLEAFLARPGGLSEYLGARYCQYYYYPHLGPLVLTAVALLVYLAGHWLIRLAGPARSRILPFVPPLLLLIAYNQYTFQLESGVALVAALMSAAVYMSVAGRVDAATVKAALFAAISAAVYYVAGGVYVLFAVLCALSEVLARRRCALGVLYLLAAVGIPLLGKHLFDVSLAAAYFRPGGVCTFEKIVPGAYYFEGAVSGERLPEESWAAGYHLSGPAELTALLCLYLFFVNVPIVPVFQRGWARFAPAVSSASGKLGRYCLHDRLKPVCAILALSVAGASVARYTLDRDARTVLRTNYLARMEMWPEFLDEVERYPLPEYPASLMVDVNRALFETGRLGSRMFSYPQSPHVLFQLGRNAAALKGGCEVLFKLGRINEAEHAALEALEMNGERPEILRLLAEIYLVKRRPGVARVFLRVLSKDLVHGPLAEERLRRLDDEPLSASDPTIRRLQALMPLTDMVTESREQMLLALLARNRKNRMAFEYLMAHYLLTRQPGKIALHIDRLDDFGPREFDYPSIPEHYAEALLLYSHNVNRPLDEPPNLHGRAIRAETLERVRQVIQVAYDFREDKEGRAEVLAARFATSGCRYLLTGESGGAR